MNTIRYTSSHSNNNHAITVGSLTSDEGEVVFDVVSNCSTRNSTDGAKVYTNITREAAVELIAALSETFGLESNATSTINIYLP